MKNHFQIGDMVIIQLNENQYKVGKINLIFIDKVRKELKYKIEDDNRLYLEENIEVYNDSNLRGILNC